MKISGAQLLAEMLAGYEVSHVFMVPALHLRERAPQVHSSHPLPW